MMLLGKKYSLRVYLFIILYNVIYLIFYIVFKDDKIFYILLLRRF